MNNLNLKDFLINENKYYLNKKVSDILSSLQELKDEMESIGSRDLNRYSEQIVSHIRRILHTSWPKENAYVLKSLQKVGVAIMKAMEEKNDLQTIIASSVDVLEKLLSKNKIPINKLVSTKTEPQPEEKLNQPEEKMFAQENN